MARLRAKTSASAKALACRSKSRRLRTKRSKGAANGRRLSGCAFGPRVFPFPATRLTTKSWSSAASSRAMRTIVNDVLEQLREDMASHGWLVQSVEQEDAQLDWQSVLAEL